MVTVPVPCFSTVAAPPMPAVPVIVKFFVELLKVTLVGATAALILAVVVPVAESSKVTFTPSPYVAAPPPTVAVQLPVPGVHVESVPPVQVTSTAGELAGATRQRGNRW